MCVVEQGLMHASDDVRTNDCWEKRGKTTKNEITRYRKTSLEIYNTSYSSMLAPRLV